MPLWKDRKIPRNQLERLLWNGWRVSDDIIGLMGLSTQCISLCELCNVDCSLLDPKHPPANSRAHHEEGVTTGASQRLIVTTDAISDKLSYLLTWYHQS